MIDGLIAHRGGAVPPELIAAAHARRDAADARTIAARIEAFFKQPRATLDKGA